MGLIKNLWRSESTSERVGTVIQWVGWKLFHHFVYRPAKHAYAIAHRVYRVLRYLYLVLAWGYTKYEARTKVAQEKKEAEEKAKEAEAKEQRADEEMDRKLNEAMGSKKGAKETEMEEKENLIPSSPARKHTAGFGKSDNLTKNFEKAEAKGLKNRNVNVRDANEPTYAPLRDL